MGQPRSKIAAVVLIFVTATAALVVTSAVKAGVDDPAKNPMAAENVQRGEKLYQASCSFCHGPTGKGSATGPSLIDSSLVRHDKDGDLISPVIHDGRVEKGMPPFPIFEKDQMADIVAFLHARVAVTDSRETAGPRGGYQMKQLLTGDAAAGKAYFEGAGGCIKCHSTTADLKGIATKYQPTELEGRILYPRGKSSTVMVTMADGQKIEGTLLHLDPFYVALLDKEGNYHSWDLPSVKVQVNDPLSGHLTLLGKYTNKDVHDLFAYLETLK